MKSCPSCGQSFEDDARFCPIDGVGLSVPPGTVLAGRFRIERELGHGGMGVVYLATQLGIDRPCALKMVRAEALADHGAIERFKREAEILGLLGHGGHPHFVAIHDFFVAEDGVAYLAMEWVDGRTLHSLLEEVGALSPRPAARIIWQIANALEFAHARKIVHRDLKPGNIMLTSYGQWDDFVKVVDFGIAKAFGPTGQPAITSRGHPIGTPAYMSPEQWHSHDIDQRSDLYSLGLIAVRMMAGGLPQHGSELRKAGREILEALPTTADWPESLKAVLARSLARDPRDRFETVGEFRDAFVGAVTEWIPPVPGIREPWEARLSSGMPQPVPQARPRRRLLVATLGALVLALFGVWVSRPLWTSKLGDLQPPAASARRIDSAPVAPNPPVVTPVPGRTGSKSLRPDSAGGSVPRQPLGGSWDIPSVLARLGRLVDLRDPVVDSMRHAVGISEALLGSGLPDTVRVEVVYRMAEAKLFLGDSVGACDSLRQIKPRADAPRWTDRSIQALLDRSCGQPVPE